MSRPTPVESGADDCGDVGPRVHERGRPLGEQAPVRGVQLPARVRDEEVDPPVAG